MTMTRTVLHHANSKNRHLQLQLFLVSRGVRSETLPLFLSRNIFYLMGTGKLDLPYFPDLLPPFDGHVTRLSVAFDRFACDSSKELLNLQRHRQLFVQASGDEWVSPALWSNTVLIRSETIRTRTALDNATERALVATYLPNSVNAPEIPRSQSAALLLSMWMR